MERRKLTAHVDALQDTEVRRVRIEFPLNTVDYRGRVFDAESFDTSIRPLLLWSHDDFDPPVGSVIDVRIEDGKYVAEGVLANTRLANDLWALLTLDPPGLTSASIGWIPEEELSVKGEDGRSLRLQRGVKVLDVSFVNFPGMPGATGRAIDRMVPVHGGRIKVTEEWDGDAAVARLRDWADGDMDKYEQGFAVVEGDPENLGSYKFPHHDVDSDGLFLSTAGVRAAFAAAQGARSGQGNEDAVRHLEAHREAIQEAQQDRLRAGYRLGQIIARIDSLLKEGSD